MADLRCRNYALITYHTEEVIETVLNTYADRIRHHAYILHDKDQYEADWYEKDENGKDKLLHKKGELKESHYHLLLCLNNAMTLSAVRNLFPIGANTLGQAVRDKADCFVYLNHKDKPEKYQYPDDAIKCDDLNYWKGIQSGENDDRTLNVLEDILRNVPFRELAKRYGRDLVINYQKYREFALAIRRSEAELSVQLPEGMTVKDMPKSEKLCQIEIDDAIFDSSDGRVVVDGKTGEVKEYF